MVLEEHTCVGGLLLQVNAEVEASINFLFQSSILRTSCMGGLWLAMALMWSVLISWWSRPLDVFEDSDEVVPASLTSNGAQLQIGTMACT